MSFDARRGQVSLWYDVLGSPEPRRCQMAGLVLAAWEIYTKDTARLRQSKDARRFHGFFSVELGEFVDWEVACWGCC